jgi:polyvinyl alcohol dehydrogenase (cytochrome)
MQQQGASLTDAEKRSLAEYLGGHALEPSRPTDAARCHGKRAEFDLNDVPAVSGWGMSVNNARFVPDEVSKMSAKDVGALKLKWAFGFAGATRARSQPAVAGGAVYVGSQDGTVYALDFETGCVRWTFAATGEVRTAPIVENWKAGDRHARPLVFVGDSTATIYALDARHGTLIWSSKADPHPRAVITATPQLFENRLYVSVSSTEWAAAADPDYACCTFRGGIAVLDVRDGKVIWRAYSIAEAPRMLSAATSHNSARWGPAGAPTWNTPTIDPKRRRVYVGSGESYTSPVAPTSDSVLAFDLDSGKLLWHYQGVSGDAWNMACYVGGGPNCPKENGPDLDIGASPILATIDGRRDVILVGQKSAEVFALDPDDNGKLLWKRRVGRGGAAAGVHWGMTFANGMLFVPNSDFKATPQDEVGPARPGLTALEPLTGKVAWFTPAINVCPQERGRECDPGLSAAATSISGVIFAGALDGHLRAYDAADGHVIWDYDTVRSFETVNGVPARGGTLEAAGPIVINGVVLVNSGYMYGRRMAGNVLLAFAPPRLP